jgi:hypothetical protein
MKKARQVESSVTVQEVANKYIPSLCGRKSPEWSLCRSGRARKQWSREFSEDPVVDHLL